MVCGDCYLLHHEDHPKQRLRISPTVFDNIKTRVTEYKGSEEVMKVKEMRQSVVNSLKEFQSRLKKIAEEIITCYDARAKELFSPADLKTINDLERTMIEDRGETEK